jgi:hypothetical protein
MREPIVSMTDLANAFGTDKGTTTGEAHSYTCYYELLLEPRRNNIASLLEIGLAIGGPEVGAPASREVRDAPSVRMWQDYFVNAHIYGLDISDFSRFESDRFTFFRADCGVRSELEQVAASGVPFDLIVDDGSHASFHQQLSFACLFGNLRSRGLYIIEDLHWVPEVYQDSLPPVPRTEVFFERFLTTGRFEGSSAVDADTWDRLAREIAGVYLVDEQSLSLVGKQFNRIRGIGSDVPAPAQGGARTFRSYARGLYARGLRRRIGHAFKAMRGRPILPPGPTIKLAVIQKA